MGWIIYFLGVLTGVFGVFLFAIFRVSGEISQAEEDAER